MPVCVDTHTCVCVRAKYSVILLYLLFLHVFSPLPLSSCTILTLLPTCCYLFSFPSLTPLPSLFFSLSLFLSLLLSPPVSVYECVHVLRAASQDDGEVRAALGTSSKWRGLRPWDALAAISQGSPVIVSPDGLQVTPGKKIARPIQLHLFEKDREA